jgi:hypothetical protein
MDNGCQWLVLVLSVPASNPAARMRVWRGLKALGCAVLRDGVYLLPAQAGTERALLVQGEDAVAAGGTAHLLHVNSSGDKQAMYFQSLFDRSGEYAVLLEAAGALEKTFPEMEAGVLSRALKRLQRDYERIAASDFFPGFARQQAESALNDLRVRLETSSSPGEPQAAAGEVPCRNVKDYRGRLWATRKHMWADRMASAWLIHRFIDPGARFCWLERPGDCPEGALGFDFDGATFTHVGNRVTFEVLLASFGLDTDAALTRIGNLVHYLDVGGVPLAEAAGLEMILRGIRKEAGNDDVLLREATRIFDSLQAAFTEENAAQALGGQTD